MKTKKVRKHRAAHQTYFKHICQNCDQIAEIYMRLHPVKRAFVKADLKQCPHCHSEKLTTKMIDKIEYVYIHQQWDLIDQGELSEEEAVETTAEKEDVIPVIDLSAFYE